MIPRPQTIAVIGGLAAGPSAAAKAARTNPAARVVLFEQGESISYGICEIPYYVAGEVSEKDLVIHTPESLQREKRVEVHTLTRVERINAGTRTLDVRDLRTGATRRESYDRLILAAGSVPRTLGIEGEDARNVFHVKSLEDGLQIRKYLDGEPSRTAVVIGGGYCGVEMAEALVRRGLSVTMLQQDSLPLPHVGSKAATHVRETLAQHGVTFIPETQVVGLHRGPQQRVTHVLTAHQSFGADIVIIAVGVRPNTQLAVSAGIRTGRFGGVTVDARLRTSVETILAAGDCCEVRNLVNNRPMFVPLATLASRMGSVAGENAAGGRAAFPGAIRAIALRCFEVEVVHIGLTPEEAREAGMSPECVTVESTSTAHMMPDSKPLFVTLTADRGSRRILGADLWGGGGAVLRGNALAVAIQHHLTVDDAQKFDLPYAPPFSPLWDPIIIAANAMARSLERNRIRP